MSALYSTLSLTFVSVAVQFQPTISYIYNNIEIPQPYSNASFFFIPPFPMPRALLSLSLLLLILAAVSHGGDHAANDEPSSSESVNLRANALILVKIYCLILVFFGTFIGGVSPCFLKWNETFLVLGTQFAGGVFLGTAMMHFLSDSNETFGDLTSVEYPFAFMLACAGYLMTMFADCLVSYVYGKGASGGEGDVELQGWFFEPFDLFIYYLFYLALEEEKTNNQHMKNSI